MLNVSIPPIYCHVRRGYLKNFNESLMEEFEDAVIFGASSIPGRAVLFHAQMSNGAVFFRLPISAFVQYGKKDAPHIPFHHLQLFNSFSYYMSVTQFSWLENQSVTTMLKDGDIYQGHYLLTLDWCHPDANTLDTDLSEVPQEHKCGHVLELDNGCYAIQPNNRIMWHDPSFTLNKGEDLPDYEVNRVVFDCEAFEKWELEDTDKTFYGVKHVEE